MHVPRPSLASLLCVHAMFRARYLGRCQVTAPGHFEVVCGIVSFMSLIEIHAALRRCLPNL